MQKATLLTLLALFGTSFVTPEAEARKHTAAEKAAHKEACKKDPTGKGCHHHRHHKSRMAGTSSVMSTAL